MSCVCGGCTSTSANTSSNTNGRSILEAVAKRTDPS
jgi:hypothetical protein